MTPTRDETPQQARALDALLAADVMLPPSDGLRRAILREFQAQSRVGFWTAFWRELGGLRIAGPALAASLAMGVIGAAVIAPAPTAEHVGANEEAPGYAEIAMLDNAYEDYLQ